MTIQLPYVEYHVTGVVPEVLTGLSFRSCPAGDAFDNNRSHYRGGRDVRPSLLTILRCPPPSPIDARQSSYSGSGRQLKTLVAPKCSNSRSLAL